MEEEARLLTRRTKKSRLKAWKKGAEEDHTAEGA